MIRVAGEARAAGANDPATLCSPVPVNSLVCSTGLPAHMCSLKPFVYSHRMPPWVPLHDRLALVLPRHLMLEHFCLCTFSQAVPELHRTGYRVVRYYFHCHCRNPNSLQCLAARSVALYVFLSNPVGLVSSQKFPLTPICCNTLHCVPVQILGMSIRGCVKHFFIRTDPSMLENVIMLMSAEECTVVLLRDGSLIVCKECCCGDPVKCMKQQRRMIDCMRLTSCCSFQ
nr:E4.2 [Bearded dragon adenovirus 1]